MRLSIFAKINCLADVFLRVKMRLSLLITTPAPSSKVGAFLRVWQAAENSRLGYFLPFEGGVGVVIHRNLTKLESPSNSKIPLALLKISANSAFSSESKVIPPPT
jgi:hypothetical protein